MLNIIIDVRASDTPEPFFSQVPSGGGKRADRSIRLATVTQGTQSYRSLFMPTGSGPIAPEDLPEHEQASGRPLRAIWLSA